MNSTPGRGWIFRNVSAGNVAAISNGGEMTLGSHLELGNNFGIPNVEWSAGSGSTGMVIFYLPGDTNNYGMVHMVFDIYEYDSPKVATVIIGGHNWSNSWYNVGCNVIGYTDKQVRLGFKDGRFVVVFGTSGSTWTYGTIRLRKIHNASFYNNVMNMTGNWSAVQTTTESFTNITGDIRLLRTPANFIANGEVQGSVFRDVASSGYYLDPDSTTSLRTVGSWRSDSAAWDGDFAGKIQYHSSNWYFQYAGLGIFRNSGGTNVTTIDTSGNIVTNGNVTGGEFIGSVFKDSANQNYYLDPASTSVLNTVKSVVYDSLYAGNNSGINRGSYPYAFGFQEGGAWSSPFPDMVFQYHTGITMAANASYQGVRFKADYADDTLIFQINGGSNYIYKYYWMYTNTTGIYSDTNSAHINPNSTSTHTQWAITGSKNSYGGIYDGYSGVNGIMYDSGGNGGVYREANGRWYWYHNVGNNCMGIGSSSTSSSYYLYVSGAIYATGNITAYSDARKKENVITIENALEKVNNLRGVYYNRIDDEKKTKQIGVIAQEINEVVPEVVTYAEDVDEYGVSYGNLAGLFIEAIKEQTDIINSLKKEIAELKAKLEK
jgi:hypothetical protein